MDKKGWPAHLDLLQAPDDEDPPATAWEKLTTGPMASVPQTLRAARKGSMVRKPPAPLRLQAISFL